MANISNDKLINVIPSVGEYQRELDSLNNQLGKTTLTGKISSLDVAETLFIYMEETQERFSKLQQGLVDSLIEESLNKVSGDIDSKVTAVASLLEATFVNRGVDSVLIAQDRDVKALLKDPTNMDVKHKVEDELKVFLSQFSFYGDAFIISNDGKILVNFKTKQKHTSESFIRETMSSSDLFTTFFGESELEPKKRYSLMYSSKVVDENNQTIGAVVLPFDLESEMSKIKIDENKSISSVISKDGVVLASSNTNVVSLNTHIKPSSELALVKYKGIDYLSKSKEMLSEEPHITIHSNVMIPLSQAFKKDSKENELELDEELLENSHLISAELKEIRDQSEEINEDLIDVVINGEIIASKRRAYALNPILENIRIISERINVSFSSSIADIHDTIISSKLDDVKFRSSTALNMLSRILYFQINDARHTATIDEVKESASAREKTEELRNQLTRAIERVNTLNNHYHNIYVFDNSGMVVATSNASESGMVGKGVESDVVRRALSAGNGGYVMTSFASSQSYSNKNTYVVSAPIINDSEQVVGAVAVVLDGLPIISTILKKALPIDDDETVLKGSYSLLATRDGEILAINGDTEIKVGDKLDIPANIYANATTEGVSELIKIGGENFAVGASAINSYRGFEVADNKRNDIVALIFAKI